MIDEQQQQGEDLQGTDLSAFCGPGCAEAEGRPSEELDMSVANAQNEKEKELERRARSVYESGEALQFIEECCHRRHVGDEILLRTLILSAAHTQVMNAALELNLNISGAAGSGKSHAVETVLDTLPESKKLYGRFSDKAVLYAAEKMYPGTVICFDDQGLSRTAAELMKQQTSSAQKPLRYHVVVEQKIVEMTTPPRVTRWFVKADAPGAADEQTRDRELRLFADGSQEQYLRIRNHINELAKNPGQFLDDDADAVCKKIWGLLPETIVSIPYAHRINFGRKERLRSFNLFLGLIRASAILAGPKREQRERKGHLEIDASEEDFQVAAGIMNQILEGEKGNQKHGLTQKQSRIINHLKTLPTGEYAFKELRETLHIAPSTFEDAVKGRGEGEVGLRRIPGVDVVRHEGRLNFIEWNKEQFLIWDEADTYFVLEDEA